MTPSTTFRFLSDLKKHNDRSWMEQHKKEYLQSRDTMLAFVKDLIRETGRFDPEILLLEPAKCMFRINRDTRFSANKDPYKTNMGAFMNKGGKKIQAAGYYVHIEPGASFIAGGLYMPMPEQLSAIRQEIDYNLDQWIAILKQKSFRNYFPDGLDKEHTLSRPPKGYDAENPAIEFLKLKSFTVSHPVSDSFFQKSGAVSDTVAIFKSMQPMIRFLNQALDN
ncbi:MAG TPA: TIGR02453 family protein [Chitinophagaceae bacterium]|nr:TIGR02453 family protein [Chitinophagaceae bacterium]